jgi:hypothetical protein
MILFRHSRSMDAAPSRNLRSIGLVFATYNGWYIGRGNIRRSPNANESRARMDHDDLGTASVIGNSWTRAQAPEPVDSPSIAKGFLCRTFSLSLAVSVP